MVNDAFSYVIFSSPLKKVGATLTLDRLDLALPSDTAGPKRDGVTNVLSLRPTILLLELNKKRELKVFF